MKIKRVAAIGAGQDGAFWGDYLFRFDGRRHGWVWDARPLDAACEEEVELPLLCSFELDPSEPVYPHFNAVCFGAEYYAPEDEFPLLYANVYNNYAREDDRKEGVCLVYRVLREGMQFSMQLVQQIRVGFVQEQGLWLSEGKTADIRPYGNFLVDPQRHLLIAFTMRDADQTTRYFTFRLPTLADGAIVILRKEDILDQFDTPYHLFLQGACWRDGKVYSTEGFGEHEHPALRIIDLQQRRQIHHTDLWDMGITVEAEWIDFRHDRCYYSDAHGGVFLVEFETE